MIFQRKLQREMEPYLQKPEMLVVTGMRRTGKTTLLQVFYDQIKSNNKLFLDLENPLYQRYFEGVDFENVRFHLEMLGLNFKEQAYLFLDEIQSVKNLPHVLKYLFDHYRIKAILTGSSSFYLKHHFSESLVGRKYLFELFPLSFDEFLVFKGERLKPPKANTRVTSVIFDTFSRFYEEYLYFGGFPGVVLKETVEEKKLALKDIFSSYFQLEVMQFSDFRKTTVIRDLMLLLLERVGSKLDLQKLASELGISRPTLYDYLSFLEGTYFIHLIKPYSKSRDVEIRGAEKVYACDSGLLTHAVNLSEGALFENNIFQQLQLKGEIHYFQKKNRAEIDFIVQRKTAFEIKLKAVLQDFTKLKKLAKNLGLQKSYLVSRRFSSAKDVLYPFQI